MALNLCKGTKPNSRPCLVSVNCRGDPPFVVDLSLKNLLPIPVWCADHFTCNLTLTSSLVLQVFLTPSSLRSSRKLGFMDMAPSLNFNTSRPFTAVSINLDGVASCNLFFLDVHLTSGLMPVQSPTIGRPWAPAKLASVFNILGYD